ncbi:MAG TPA: PsiF family protein [Nitrospira sp.]|nr:PsiF family protein [Nitrospira sp.]
MKITGLIALSCFVAALGFAHAAEAASPQQSKMKACNAAADEKGLSGEGKGEARQVFMKECLSAKSGKGGKTAQQEKMKTCNKEAGEKKLAGEERKQFMSSCLSS